MRTLLFFFAFAVGAQEKPAIGTMAWLAGKWKGTVGKASYEEVWLPAGGGTMLGMSRTLVGERMAGFEFLRIVERQGELFYIAQPNGRPPTEFKLTSGTASKAVFENAANDFPKVITYEKDASGNVVATIEGEVQGKNRKEQFRFQRAPN
ncbi:MAG: hypothetical protein JNM66_26755 [Bryobacterales bacterium]|nr:hypothetical protein [Bryobacterales bacterium]